jgi:MFS family permease
MKTGTIDSKGVLSLANHLFLSIYWFSLNFQTGAMVTVLLPTEVLARSSEAAKPLYLGLIVGLGSLLAIVVQPLTGAFSDRCRHAWGRRRPFLLAGALINVIGLIWMPRASSILALALAFLVVQLGYNSSGAAYQGYIPDRVSGEHQGKASGYMGFMTLTGTIVSFIAGAMLIHPQNTYPIYTAMAAVLLAGLIVTLWKVPDAPASNLDPQEHRTWINSLRNRNFAWLLVTRAFVMLSVTMAVSFEAYFLRDQIKVTDYVNATLLMNGLGLVIGLASALIAGAVSDRVDRKMIVCLACSAIGLAFLVFVFSPPWAIVLTAALLFGLGYGAFLSVDWALALDVLPDRTHNARDLGIWGFATTVPATLAPLIGGVIVYRLQPFSWGYPGLFLLAVGAAAAGAVLVWRIHPVKNTINQI